MTTCSKDLASQPAPIATNRPTIMPACGGRGNEWRINKGNWTGSIDLGTHPVSYQIAGVGDFNGGGTAGVF